ncbi:MAG: hypothetical protein IJ493_09390 [Clostridia bacterium]|nr:hypothetical protein [Clostridia bacterium]
MKKTAIIYGTYSGVQKKAVERLTSIILDGTGEYPSCFRGADFTDDGGFRCFYIGTAADNPHIRRLSDVHPDGAEGYSIVVRNDTAVIEGSDDAGVLYGCVDFADRYLAQVECTHDSEQYFRDVWNGVMPDFTCTSAPSVKQRGIWTWGHVIYDYRGFFDNLARLKLNTAVIWNDFVPVNGAEMIAYAHDCNVSVIWGFSWAWGTNCAAVNLAALDEQTDAICALYEREYAKLGGDGIYFQSFTELNQERIGGVLIAEAVTDFVNNTAARLWEKHPGLELHFGLHATSVAEKLSYIAKVHPDIRIVWENCGAFPFSYIPRDVENFDETVKFVRRITHLRGEGERFGAVTKGFTKLDWGCFEHQPGSYAIGGGSERWMRGRAIRKEKIWRYIQAYWLANADRALEMVRVMCGETKGDTCITALVEDGLFERNIMYPVALYAEMLWDCGGDIKEMMSRVALRDYVTFA